MRGTTTNERAYTNRPDLRIGSSDETLSEIARCYGRLMAERKRNGLPIAPNDAWIAACAARHTVPLVTHNAKDFEGIASLEVITAQVES